MLVMKCNIYQRLQRILLMVRGHDLQYSSMKIYGLKIKNPLGDDVLWSSSQQLMSEEAMTE